MFYPKSMVTHPSASVALTHININKVVREHLNINQRSDLRQKLLFVEENNYIILYILILIIILHLAEIEITNRLG